MATLQKKGLPPPALMINYITCRCLSACLACCFTFRLSYFLVPYLLAVVLSAVLLPCCVTALLINYNTSNNPFNTLVSVYISFDSILFQYSN